MGRIYKAVKLSSGKKSEMTVAFVDTGADETVISKRIAKRLDLKMYGEYEALSAAKEKITGKLATVTISDGKIADELVVGVSDQVFMEGDEEGVEAIIGIDFLQRNNVRLSFKG